MQHQFKVLKNHLSNLRIRENLPNMIKNIHTKLIANILDGWRLAVFLRLRTSDGRRLSPLLFNIILEVQVPKGKKEKEKEEIKPSLFADDISIYILKNPKASSKKTMFDI